MLVIRVNMDKTWLSPHYQTFKTSSQNPQPTQKVKKSAKQQLRTFLLYNDYRTINPLSWHPNTPYSSEQYVQWRCSWDTQLRKHRCWYSYQNRVHPFLRPWLWRDWLFQLDLEAIKQTD